MKGFINCLGVCFAVVGGVIGAGFITGAEILYFYSGENLVGACLVSFVLFAVFICVLMLAGKRFKNQNTANSCVLGRFSKISESISALTLTAL